MVAGPPIVAATRAPPWSRHRFAQHRATGLSDRELFFADTNGDVDLTTLADVVRLSQDNNFRTFHLDANLSLGLANCGRGALAPDRAPHLAQLITIAFKSRSAVQWELGVEELATTGLDVNVESRRTELERQVAAGLSSVLTFLGISGRHQVFVHRLGAKEVSTYRPVHLAFYTHCLKIEEIANRGLKRDQAIPNVAEYLSWANDQLKNISAHSLQLALDVFGGEPRAARLLRVGSDKPLLVRARNAAWDMVHAFAMHYETARPVGKKLKRTLLATTDQALHYAATSCVVAAFVRDSPIGDFTLTGMRFTQPHFQDRKTAIQEVTTSAYAKQRGRIDAQDSASPAAIRKELANLEARLRNT